MTHHTCSNYEIVSIADRNRILLTVDIGELSSGFPSTIHSAKISNGDLVLECTGESGTGFELRFPGLPEPDVMRLYHFQASLCGISAKGQVEFAKAFPSPSAMPRIRMT